jgi:hypothetical protein
MRVTKDGSTEFAEIYIAIGYAVTKWEHLETRLLLLYSVLASGDMTADNQAYSAINSFRSRSTAIRRLAEYRLRPFPETKKELLKLLDKIEKLATRRNEVVHGHISDMHFQIQDGKTVKEFKGLYVSNSVYGSTIGLLADGKAYSYNHEDIIAFANEFEKHRHVLNDLTDKCAHLLSKISDRL